jgi:hypothetical protein
MALKIRKSKTKVKIEERHEVIVNDEPKMLSAFGVGDVSHQGDLIIVGIRHLPLSAKPRANRQLADGDTQGSRHILVRGELFDALRPVEVVELIRQATKCTVTDDLIGPVFVGATDPTPNDLTHPEHGNQGFPAGQVCAVVYQRNLDAEERARRVQD